VDLSGVGKRPEWSAWVKDDKVMRSLQKQQDSNNATYQQKEKELSQVRQQMESADQAEKSELAVQAAKIKEDMAKAEYNAALRRTTSANAPSCSSTQGRKVPNKFKIKIVFCGACGTHAFSCSIYEIR